MAVTVIDDVPVTPPVTAAIVVLPAPTAVTRPDCDTVATAALPVDQVNVPAYFGGDALAESCTVPPTVTVADDGLTVTDLTPEPPRTRSGSVGETEF